MSDETNEYYMRCVRVNQGAKGETEYFVKVDIAEHDVKVRSGVIDEFVSMLKNRILEGKMIDDKFAYIDECDIDEISEQLKGEQ